jgi:hypothetical protein
VLTSFAIGVAPAGALAVTTGGGALAASVARASATPAAARASPPSPATRAAIRSPFALALPRVLIVMRHLRRREEQRPGPTTVRTFTHRMVQPVA